MLVVHGNVTVNIDNVCDFTLIEKKHSIEFVPNRSGTYPKCFLFDSYDEAYKAYHSILRAYSNEKKIFIVSAMNKHAGKK